MIEPYGLSSSLNVLSCPTLFLMPENGHVTANMALTNGSLVQRILLLEVNYPQFNKLR